jgi:hypothetical protein
VGQLTVSRNPRSVRGRAGPLNFTNNSTSKIIDHGCVITLRRPGMTLSRIGHRRASSRSGLILLAQAQADQDMPTPVPALSARASVQRSVHDLTSLQYQRTSAHASPPSGTSRPSGRSTPHMEHSATSSGRRRLSLGPAGAESATASRRPTGNGSGGHAWGIAIADEACEAMTSSTRDRSRGSPLVPFPRPGHQLVTPMRQARSYSSPLVVSQARSYQARWSTVVLMFRPLKTNQVSAASLLVRSGGSRRSRTWPR